MTRPHFTRSARHPSLLRRAAPLAAAGSLWFTSLAPAQDAAPLPEARLEAQPTAPAELEGVVRQNGSGLRLNFQDSAIDAVLDELSTAAGFIIVKEVKPEGRVTLVSRQPVSPDEAVVLLNTVLHQAGYAAIQQGRVLKIVARDQAKRANIPVRVGSDPAAIEPTDQLVTQVIPLRFANATQLKEDLTPLINPDADFASNASSNALVMTDTSANIRRVVEIVRALDTSLADSVDVRVFALQYASATSAAALINSVFENADPVTGDNQQQGDRDGRGGREGRGGGGDGGPGAFFRRMQEMAQGNNGGAQRNRVRAAADERTNTVVVTGPTDTLPVVERVLKELDANPAAEVSVFVYPLKNATALNAEAVLNSLFNGTTPNRSTTNANQATRQSNISRSSRNTGGGRSSGSGAFGGSGGGFGESSNNQLVGRYGGQATGGGGWQGGGNRNLSQNAVRTAAELTGEVTIIADPDTNSLLVRTAPKNYERVKEVLEEMDRPLPQVLIKVLIAEVTHDNDLDIGVEFSAINLRNSGLGQTGGTDFGLADATGGLVVQILESDFTATLRALEEDGKLEVLSRPYILASDNQLASITVGSEVPFITSSRITENGQTINVVEYDDVGILLDVIPHINPDGLVILDVVPEISTLTADTVPISDTVDAPVIAKRSAQSRVAVQTGQTIVIGGLMEDRRTQAVSKIPFLGDIPILGHAFKRQENTGAKTELLIFLTPHVASDPSKLKEMSKQELEGTRLTPDAIAPGAFQEHMEGMQRGSLPPSPEPGVAPLDAAEVESLPPANEQELLEDMQEDAQQEPVEPAPAPAPETP